MTRQRPKSHDLRQTLDERRWVNDHPVHCPITYCDAHKYRWALCGTEGEPLIGIHEGRIRAAPRFRARMERLIQTLIDGGSSRADAVKTASFALWARDAEECGPDRTQK